MLSCYDVAQYFLAKADEDAGDLMSNLKLQKLVYYAQGFSLALFNKPVFPSGSKPQSMAPSFLPCTTNTKAMGLAPFLPHLPWISPSTTRRRGRCWMRCTPSMGNLPRGSCGT